MTFNHVIIFCCLCFFFLPIFDMWMTVPWVRLNIYYYIIIIIEVICVKAVSHGWRCCSVQEQLTCPSCKVKKKDAVLTKCFHVFCLDCLKTRYETRQRKCPKCNATFGANDFHRIYLEWMNFGIIVHNDGRLVASSEYKDEVGFFQNTKGVNVLSIQFN